MKNLTQYKFEAFKGTTSTDMNRLKLGRAGDQFWSVRENKYDKFKTFKYINLYLNI